MNLKCIFCHNYVTDFTVTGTVPRLISILWIVYRLAISNYWENLDLKLLMFPYPNLSSLGIT